MGADAVVVATNHDEFCQPPVLASVAERAAPGALVVDPWNSFGAARVFAPVEEVVQHAREHSLEPSSA
jgi:UDP-N-acetyl-D-mannosaminuronic acid dehydrogenase